MNVEHVYKQIYSDPALDKSDVRSAPHTQKRINDLTNTIASQYDLVSELYRRDSNHNDQDLKQIFEQHLRNVSKDYVIRIQQEMPLIKYQTHYLRAKYALSELCFSKAIEFLEISQNDKAATLFQQIHDEHATIFKELTYSILSQDDQQVINQQNELISMIEQKNKKLETENQEQSQTIQLLLEENQKYLNMIIRHGKMDRFAIQGKQQTINEPDVFKDRSNLVELSPNKNQNQNYNQIKYLSLNQLKETIEDIYESKKKYDQKCNDSKLPKETMEQYMYTYLNQKYGLKALIIEQASMIIQTLKKFSKQDNDVAVFGKILKNECDEEFRYVQTQVKQTISELLKMFLRAQHPQKTYQELREILANKITSAITLEESYEIIDEKLKQKIQILSQDNKIEYMQFTQGILDFQLCSHEKYLTKFIQLFRAVDTEKQGTITDAQFLTLISSLNTPLTKEDTKRFLNILDPYSHQQITFSQIVALLSQEVIITAKGSHTILQQLFD